MLSDSRCGDICGISDGGELDTMWLPAGGGLVDAALCGGSLAIACGAACGELMGNSAGALSKDDKAGTGFAGTVTPAGGALLARPGLGRMLATHCWKS